MGGSENHLRQLIPQLNRLGWRSDLLIPSPVPDRIANLTRAFAPICGRVMVVRTRSDVSPRLVGITARLMRTGRYSVIHSHLVHADWHVALASLAGQGAVLVSTKHNDNPFRRRLAFRLAERAAARRYALIIAISDSLREFTLRWARPAAPVVTVRYGLNVDDGYPTRADTPEPTLLTIARLIEQKGLDILIHAMSKVVDYEPSVTLLIAGGGPEKARLEALIRKLGLEEIITLLGHRDDVPQLMQSAWLLVHPARWEGFGLVFLEAMKEALPIVATSVGAVPEIVVDGMNGRLVPPEDPQSLAEAVVTTIRDPEFRAAAGNAGLDRLRREFSAEGMGQETVEAYCRARRREELGCPSYGI